MDTRSWRNSCQKDWTPAAGNSSGLLQDGHKELEKLLLEGLDSCRRSQLGTPSGWTQGAGKAPVRGTGNSSGLLQDGHKELEKLLLEGLDSCRR
jgi:hypothetical protein